MGEYKHHAAVMADVIKGGRAKRFCELGVNRGTMTKHILYTIGNLISEYWAVDLWWTRKPHTLDKWEGRHFRCCELMAHFPALRVVRMDATRSASLFPDGYFDCIFLDTSHQYEATRREIHAWEPKIRFGGLFCGHDYGHPKYIGVKKAVDEIYGGMVNILEHDVWIVRMGNGN